MIIKVCKQCGKEFSVPDYKKNAKFCCIECAHKALHAKPNCICEVCGKEFHLKQSAIDRNKHHTCSVECLNKLKSILYKGAGNHQYGLKGDKNASFKGNIILHRNNNLIERLVYMPDHPYADKNGRVKEHRLVVEQDYKRFDIKYFEEINGKYYLKRSTQVHHINFNHNDNRIENLIPLTRSEHTKIHNKYEIIIRDDKGKITGVLKQGELLEKPEEVNQQPSLDSNIFEGSETNNRVLRDSNVDTSALPRNGEDIVRSTNNKENSRNTEIKSSVV